MSNTSDHNPNDRFFSSNSLQEDSNSSQTLNTEKSLEQMRREVQELCEQLAGGEYGHNFNSDKWIRSLFFYLKRSDARLFYSTISYYIFEMTDEEYADFSSHMDIVVHQAEQEFHNENLPLNIYKAILKFYDHVTLANQQKLMVDRRSQLLHTEVQHEIKEEVQSGIAAGNKDIISQLVGLVALFTAMSFLVFGGIASLDSIFKSVKRFINLESSVLPVLLVAVAWAFCMMNLLFAFMYFVLRLVKPEQFTIRSEKNVVQRYPVVFLTNYILLVLFVVLLGMWFAKCNGIGLPVFNVVVGHPVITFWGGIGVMLIGFIALGIFLFCSYHSKPRLSTQSEKSTKQSPKHSKS